MLKRIDEAENIIEKIPKGKITLPVEMIDYNNQKVYIPFDYIDQHLLICGSTRSGKSTLLKNLLNKFIKVDNTNSLYVLLNVKHDFDDLKDSIHFSLRNSEVAWNVLKDYVNHDENERNLYLEGIVSEMFMDTQKNTNNAFFSDTSKEILSTLIRYLGEKIKKDPNLFTNVQIKQWLNCLSVRDIQEICISMGKGSIANYYLYSDKINGQSAAILSTLNNTVERFFFQEGKKQVSIKELLNSKHKFLVLDYDVSYDRAAFFRLILNLIIKEKINRNNNTKRRVILVLDEFSVLNGKVDLNLALNVGAGCGLFTILCSQTIQQFYMLTENKTSFEVETLLAGVKNQIFFQNSDPSTTEYIKKISGQKIFEYLSTYGNSVVKNQLLESYYLNDFTIFMLKRYEAYIRMYDDVPIFKVKFINENE